MSHFMLPSRGTTDITRRQLWSAATPGRSGGPAPLKKRTSSGEPEGVGQSPSLEKTFRRLGGGGDFTGPRLLPHHLILPHGIPRLSSGGYPIFSRLTPGYLGGKLRSACNPWSVLARPEPPGRHLSSTGSPHEQSRESLLWESVSLIRIAPGRFQSQVDQSWGQVRTCTYDWPI